MWCRGGSGKWLRMPGRVWGCDRILNFLSFGKWLLQKFSYFFFFFNFLRFSTLWVFFSYLKCDKFLHNLSSCSYLHWPPHHPHPPQRKKRRKKKHVWWQQTLFFKNFFGEMKDLSILAFIFKPHWSWFTLGSADRQQISSLMVEWPGLHWYNVYKVHFSRCL